MFHWPQEKLELACPKELACLLYTPTTPTMLVAMGLGASGKSKSFSVGF